MTKIYRIEYKGGDRPPVYYTTLVALAADNSREEMGVTLSWLQKVLVINDYDGPKCKITRLVAYNKTDILKRSV